MVLMMPRLDGPLRVAKRRGRGACAVAHVQPLNGGFDADVHRQGDYAPLFAASLAVTGDLSEQVTPALHYSVTCAEDVPRVTADERAKMLERVRGKAIAERLIGICDMWPKGAMPPDFGRRRNISSKRSSSSGIA